MTLIVDRRPALWFSDNFASDQMDTNCGVIHTTEGASMPSYSGGATAPNWTAEPNFKRKRLVFVPHFGDNESARALVNSAGGVETNTANALQIELIGTCDARTHAKWTAAGVRHIYWPKAPKWALRDLAEYIAVKHKKLGIPIQGPGHAWLPYPKSFGSASGQRMTFAQWRSFRGWCGHQHVPENVHGDPGALPWDELEAMARALAGEKPAASPHHKGPRTPTVDEAYEAAAKARGNAKSKGRRSVLSKVLRLLRPLSAKH